MADNVPARSECEGLVQEVEAYLTRQGLMDMGKVRLMFLEKLRRTDIVGYYRSESTLMEKQTEVVVSSPLASRAILVCGDSMDVNISGDGSGC